MWFLQGWDAEGPLPVCSVVEAIIVEDAVTDVGVLIVILHGVDVFVGDDLEVFDIDGFAFAADAIAGFHVCHFAKEGGVVFIDRGDVGVVRAVEFGGIVEGFFFFGFDAGVGGGGEFGEPGIEGGFVAGFHLGGEGADALIGVAAATPWKYAPRPKRLRTFSQKG